jgi:hypothetical protein
MKPGVILAIAGVVLGLAAVNLAIVLALRLHDGDDRDRFPRLPNAAFLLGPFAVLGWSAAIGALTKGADEHRAEFRMARICRLLSAASVALIAAALVILFRG